MNWDTIKDYQTLIVGLIGFTGVAATLYINAAIPRWQRQREASHTANALRRLIVAELRIFEGDMKRMLSDKRFEEERTEPLVLVRENSLASFEKTLVDIRYLTVDELEAVLRCRDGLDRFLKAVAYLDPTSDPTSGTISIAPADVKKVRGAAKNTLPMVEAALAALRSETGPH